MKYICKEDTIEQMKSMNMLFSPKIVIDNMPTVTKADIVREFAERLKSKQYFDEEHYMQSVPVRLIDETLEEMEKEDE